jgi:hypothetical protein
VARRIRLGIATGALAAALVCTVAEAGTLPGIRSPSGNIMCLYASQKPAFLMCQIARADYEAALRKHCGSAPYYVDWVGFSLSAAGKGVVACAGGPAYDPQTQHPRYVTLAYGKSWRKGPFTCSSATTGITCTNGAGHLVFVSRGAYRVT